jgi:hypothetical protein|tara:strand:+ start:526 stop:645 length:120 start_codon:yes stop_codon:yes gene_type:complete
MVYGPGTYNKPGRPSDKIKKDPKAKKIAKRKLKLKKKKG